jgi:L-rhamnose mutarotase
MQRVCCLLKVKKDRIEEYKERHKAVWPEMLQALRETGWHNYSLFLPEDGLLVRVSGNVRFSESLGGHGGTRSQRPMATRDGALLRRAGRPAAR